MLFREAQIADIQQIQIVRNSVLENTLSDPGLVTDEDVKEFISERGKGWVCEIDNLIVGFAIADLKEDNIWALFIHPDHEGKAIGRKLHQLMMEWYFEQGKENAWLSTGPKTRAEQFYRKAGWNETGITGKGEIKFEITAGQWDLIVNEKNI